MQNVTAEKHVCMDPVRKDSLLGFDTIHHIPVHCGMRLSPYQKQLPDFLARMVNLHTMRQCQIHCKCPKESLFYFYWVNR